MATKTEPLTPEAAVIAEAVVELMRAKNLGKKEVAGLLDAEAPELYQWETGRRPVPIERVTVVAERLRRQPEEISERYREWKKSGGQAPLTADEDAEMSKEVQALRYVVAVLASTMRAHRPIEAAAAAQALRKKGRGKLLRDEYVREIAATLDGSADSTDSAAASAR